MNKFQERILASCIVEYPENQTFETVLNLIECDSELITVQEYWQDWYRPTLANHLRELHDNINPLINQIKNCKIKHIRY